ncbi:MAG: response regulator transcription factor [Pseudomonadota bacterium]
MELRKRQADFAMNLVDEAQSILIIEDDPNIASLVERYLQVEGFATTIALDGRSGLALAAQARPRLVVLDLMLPELDGWEVCRELRRRSNVPVLMLSAREDETDRIVGLSLGADDYVVKPFSPRELVERVKAILRRSERWHSPEPEEKEQSRSLQIGPLRLEPEKHKLTLKGRYVSLTPSEFKLLHCLMAAPGRVFSRDELLDQLYDDGQAVVDRVVDVHIGKLRKKIEPDVATPVFVETVHGIGYRFAEQPLSVPFEG